MSSLFLTDDELRQLTGRAFKSRQIAWLKEQGLPFRVNATGHPVVARAVIVGLSSEPPAPQTRGWAPRVLEARHGT